MSTSIDSKATLRPVSPGAEVILGLYFPVLDNGFVALVDYMGGDEGIDDAARCSYGEGTRQASDRRGLLRTLRRNLHTSPFEMAEIKVHMAMPIFVARQFIRHRTANVNEYSGRYSLMPALFYTPEPDDIAHQSKKNKQGRAEPVSPAVADEALNRWRAQRMQAVENYEWLNAEDVARELARIDLPLSTYTQWYWKIDIHNLLHFLGLRVDAHAQKEARAYADVLAGMVKRLAPLTFEAWIDYQFGGARMSRMEMAIVREALRPSTRGVGGVLSCATVDLTAGELASALGSKREAEEFLAKLDPQEIPSFDLDLGKATSGAYFAEAWKKAATFQKAVFGQPNARDVEQKSAESRADAYNAALRRGEL